MVEELAPEPQSEQIVAHVDQAKEILIRRQDTHLDSLAERLREPRVQAILGPMLAGRALRPVSNEDIQFVLDLGLCAMSSQGGLTIENPIYREVLPRLLAVPPMASMPQIVPTWLTAEEIFDINQSRYS